MNKVSRFFKVSFNRYFKWLLLSTFLAIAITAHTAYAEGSKGFLETLRHTETLIATTPDNGDQNPYAIVVAPVSSGKIQKGDVLVDNFNNGANLQGTGTTIVDYNPSTQKMSVIAKLPSNQRGCPGGVGLSTAMTMLKSGWIIVGSAPSKDGTTATKGDGCLIVLDSNGYAVKTITSPNINFPWGNMAVIDNGSTATLFVSNTGFGIGAPDAASPNVNKATVLRIELEIASDQIPRVNSETVIANGLAARADKDAFIIGPTGLALGNDQTTLYVSDALNSRIIAIDDATNRKDSVGAGREIVKGGLLQQPLAMATAPNGNLLVTNGKNGQVVEIDPVAGKQVFAKWIDANEAQTPPGNGDLFGIAMNASGNGFYYVQDETNTLNLAQ